MILLPKPSLLRWNWQFWLIRRTFHQSRLIRQDRQKPSKTETSYKQNRWNRQKPMLRTSYLSVFLNKESFLTFQTEHIDNFFRLKRNIPNMAKPNMSNFYYTPNRTYRILQTEHTEAFLRSRPNIPTISYIWNRSDRTKRTWRPFLT